MLKYHMFRLDVFVSYFCILYVIFCRVKHMINVLDWFYFGYSINTKILVAKSNQPMIDIDHFMPHHDIISLISIRFLSSINVNSSYDGEDSMENFHKIIFHFYGNKWMGHNDYSACSTRNWL